MPSSNSTVSNRLAGRSALITGATRGIGLAIAERFAEHGANIVLSASNLKALKETAARLNQYAVDVSFFAADLSASSEIEDLFSFAIDRHSQLDVLVNNAGMHIAKPFIDHSLEEFEHLMRVNVRSVFQLSQYAIRHMQSSGPREGDQRCLDCWFARQYEFGCLQYIQARGCWPHKMHGARKCEAGN